MPRTLLPCCFVGGKKQDVSTDCRNAFHTDVRTAIIVLLSARWWFVV